MRVSYILLFTLIYVLSVEAQSDAWYVQVGVFEEKVDLNYFSNLSGDVYHSRDNYGFHRYYKGAYQEMEKAQEASSKFSEMGYNCALISKNEMTNPCVCNPIPLPKSFLSTIQNIFFDFDKSALRPASKKQLEDLAAFLKEFPTHTTTLRAHTDSKGSNSYNEALSLRRANAAKRYLVLLGISSYRIKTETFGEINPIAKNELEDGNDTEEGRQFNRRVEIDILDKDGNILNEMVREIDVPRELEE